jgi:DNA-binding MarR family transcriptional regulator
VNSRSADPNQGAFKEAAALREALRAFAQNTEQVARRHGLTTRAYTLLLMLKTGGEPDGGATTDELAQRLRLAKSTVTELAQRAEDAGLLRRALHPSRRGAIVMRLTAKGDRQLTGAFRELEGERDELRRLIEAVPPAHSRRYD